MSDGSWVRVGAIETGLDKKTLVRNLKQYVPNLNAKMITPETRLQIGNIYLRHVTRFVPCQTGVLQHSGRATSDGRVYWTAVRNRQNSSYNYASIQYENESYTHIPRANSMYSPHEPTDHWTDKVRPGTPEWPAFVADVAKIFK